MTNTAEQIKQRLDIVNFIREYIELKPAGANFKAKCPFHEEDTPSLMISPEKQIFKCFGCGKGGDIFTFLCDYENIDFKEALKILAARAGVPLLHFDRREDSRKARILEILKLAAEFYHLTLLRSGAAASARAYLTARQVDDLSLDNFKLGYSPNEWRILFNFLQKKGFTAEEMVGSGLVKHSAAIRGQTAEYYDLFRGRVMFPINDEHGQVVGFGGRILAEAPDQPKYINTPQTEVYDKSRILYGIDKAKDSIRKNRAVVLVEGYMDVIASHSVDVKNVVAVSGTAFTVGHFELIRRFTNNILLAFDMDVAGVTAAGRAYQIANSLGLNTKVIRLSQGKDPDELIRKKPELWSVAIKESEHLVDFFRAMLLKQFDLNRVEDKKEIRNQLLPLILGISDAVERAHFLDKLALMLNVPVLELTRGWERSPQAKQAPNPVKSGVKQYPAMAMVTPEGIAMHLLALVITYIHRLKVTAELPALILEDPALDHLYKVVREKYNEKNLTTEVIAKYQEEHSLLMEEVLLLASKDYLDLDLAEAQREFLRLTGGLASKALGMERDKIIRQIKLAEAEEGNEQRVLELTKQMDDLKSVR